MQSHARVVIIGGGIMGTSLLYHLAKVGWTDSVLIEKAELTSGSTWHAAGQVGHSTSHWGLALMSKYASETYSTIETETEQSVSWHGSGSLRLAYNSDEVDWLKYTVAIGRGAGNEMEIISPDEIRKLHPFYNLDGVIAALHTPNDGHADPAGAAFAFAKGARMMGATVIRHNRVTNTVQLPNGEWKVETEKGDITCELVVNAGGTYARQMAEWVGYDLPSTNMTHHYFVTENVPEFADIDKELPVVRDDRLVSGYIRMEQKAGLIGIYEKANANTVWDDGTPWESENELFDADYDRIMPWLENAMDRMPILADLGIKRTVHGAITHPPDGNMLLGPAPGLKNYWCCCGSQVGIAWGPGAGKYLAQWMVHGAADINMREFDPRRYGDFANRDYQITKAKEDYLLRHEIPFPGFNRTAGRPVKTTAIYNRLIDQNAIFEEVFGWERPRWFATGDTPREDVHSFRRSIVFDKVKEECLAVQNRVGLIDLTAFAKIEIYGADAERFLDRLVANKLPQKSGGIVLSHFLNEKGTIESETSICKLGDNHYFLVFAGFFELRIHDWLIQHKREDENATIDVVSENFGVLSLNGPRARDVLAAVCDDPLDNANFPWLTARNIIIDGVTVRALRVSYVGELGWELYVPIINLMIVYDALKAAGEPHGMVNFGSFALNAMRMEKAFKGAGELTSEVTLPEADVMRFVKVDKGEFHGRDKTVESMDKPLPWICVYLEVDGGDIDCVGSETVFHNGVRTGQVATAGYGHRVEKSLAFAFVKPEHSAPGTELEVLLLDGKVPARVLAEPVYDPKSELPRVDA
ncbi:MAG: FAD-dependent oxidoreductase [Pseudomonadota bacterium]